MSIRSPHVSRTALLVLVLAAPVKGFAQDIMTFEAAEDGRTAVHIEYYLANYDACRLNGKKAQAK